MGAKAVQTARGGGCRARGSLSFSLWPKTPRQLRGSGLTCQSPVLMVSSLPAQLRKGCSGPGRCSAEGTGLGNSPPDAWCSCTRFTPGQREVKAMSFLGAGEIQYVAEQSPGLSAGVKQN